MTTAHPIDSQYVAGSWGVPELTKIFSDEARIQYWLDIEAALARVQGSLGIIPEEAARTIAEYAKLEKLDMTLFKETQAKTGHMIMPVLKCMEEACPNRMGEFIHYGATTQDIIDTGFVLAIRDASQYLLGQAYRLEAAILKQAEANRSVVMPGRTHGQQGLPITMGFKMATWAAEVRRNIERMKEFPQRVFLLMLHGAVGTLAGFGDKAYETYNGVAKELKLTPAPICWASSRDVFAEYLTTLALFAGTLSRIANEILISSMNEIGELREPMSRHAVGSSTMPHKRNANISEFTCAQSRIVQVDALLGMEQQLCQHERDARVWRLDFHNLPEASITLGRMLFAMAGVIEGLEVDKKNIERNINLLGGLLLSEAVMFALGEKLGKNTAHHLLRELTLAQHDNLTFIERLHANKQVKAVLTDEEIDAIFDYTKYLGKAEEEVDHVINYCKQLQKTDPTPEEFGK